MYIIESLNYWKSGFYNTHHETVLDWRVKGEEKNIKDVGAPWMLVSYRHIKKTRTTLAQPDSTSHTMSRPQVSSECLKCMSKTSSSS